MGKTKTLTVKEQRNRIAAPQIGTVVGFVPKRGKPYDVYIVDGKFYSNGRVSNFWTWRRVKEDGTLGNKVHGYGSFCETPNKYEIEITAKLVK